MAAEAERRKLAFLCALAEAQALLRERLMDLRMEFSALSDCLQSSGQLDGQKFTARLRCGHSSRMLFRVLVEPETAARVVLGAGAHHAGRLCAATSSCSELLSVLLGKRAEVDSALFAERAEAASAGGGAAHAARVAEYSEVPCLLESATAEARPAGRQAGAVEAELGKNTNGGEAMKREAGVPVQASGEDADPAEPRAAEMETRAKALEDAIKDSGPALSLALCLGPCEGLRLGASSRAGLRWLSTEVSAPQETRTWGRARTHGASRGRAQFLCELQGQAALPQPAMPQPSEPSRLISESPARPESGWGNSSKRDIVSLLDMSRNCDTGSRGEEASALPAQPTALPPAAAPAAVAEGPRSAPDLGWQPPAHIFEQQFGRTPASGPSSAAGLHVASVERPHQVPNQSFGDSAGHVLVTLHGLVTRPDLNGQVGRLIQQAGSARGRRLVLLSNGEAVRVQASRLQLERNVPPEEFCGGPSPASVVEALARSPEPLPIADLILVCGGISGEGTLDSAESFDTVTGEWTALPRMSLRRAGPGSCILGRRSYVIGGEERAAKAAPGGVREDTQPSNSVETFDPDAGAWETAPPMLEARAMPIVAVIGGTIYVVGGCALSGSLCSAECLEPGAQAWRRLPPMAEGRLLPVTGVLGGRLYVCGGCSSDGDSSVPRRGTDRFDPTTERWARLPDMVWGRVLAASGELGGHLYVCGGMDGQAVPQRHVERFNAATGCWEAAAQMCRARAGASLGAVSTPGKQLLFICGGHDSGNSSMQLSAPMEDCCPSMLQVPQVERFSPALGHWEIVAVMPSPRSMGLSVLIGEHLYIMGGRDNASIISSMVRLNTADLSWEVLSNMRHSRFRAAIGCIPR